MWKCTRKFQYRVVQRGGSVSLFGPSLEWLAQALTAAAYPLFYWASGHLAEIDFVLQKGRDIIGIEVKKGVKTHSKSLHQFISKYRPALAIRFSEKNFGRNVVDQDETRVSVLALPHYAAFCLGEF